MHRGHHRGQGKRQGRNRLRDRRPCLSRDGADGGDGHLPRRRVRHARQPPRGGSQGEAGKDAVKLISVQEAYQSGISY